MEVFVQHLTLRSHRLLSSFGTVRLAAVAAAIIGLTLLAAQITPAQTARASASWLFYHQGYYLDNGWLCYGWNSGAYRCTQHWHRAANGTLISDHAAWVPNGLPTGAYDPNGGRHAVSRATLVNRAPVRRAPVARPAPAPSGSIATQIRAVFGVYGNQAVAVATCESGLNPNAINPSSSASGLFQFLPSTWRTTSYAGYSPFNAWANIQAAHQVFQRDGNSWREWVCQP